MRDKESLLLDRLMNSSKIKSLGLKRETVSGILKDYNDTLLDILLEAGHIELDSGMNIEIVQLTDRVHVLRGTTYKSSRKYKLKLTMEESIYQKIESYYEKLKEEIV